MTASITALADFQSKEDKDKIAAMFRLEELRADSSLYAAYGDLPYNPDVVVKKKGGLEIYDKMRRDDQVKSVLALKKHIALSSGWDFDVAKEYEKEQEDVIDFLKNALSNIENPDFSIGLSDMLSFLDYGFSITEPVFKINDENKVVLWKLRTRAPHTFEIITDKYGEITEIIQSTADKDISIKPNKLIILTYSADFGNPYGTSDLQAAYRAWFSKDIIIRFWNIYLERFGNPHVIAYVPSNMKSSDKSDIMDVLNTLQAKTGIRVPDTVKLDLLFPPTGNTDFERAIDKYNMMIARSMLVPDLIGLGGKEVSGGSFALGEKHFELFFTTIQNIRQIIEKAINRKIIKNLCLWNFGLKDNFPRWRFNPITEADKNQMLQLWIDAMKSRIWKATDEEINYFRRSVKFPESDVIERHPAKPVPDEQFVSDEQLQEKRFIKLSRAKTEYEKKIDFEKIDNDLNALQEQGKQLFIPVYRKIRESILNWVETKNIIQKTRIDLVNDLKLKYLKDMQLVFRQILRDTYNAGADSARREVSIKKMTSHLPALFEAILEEKSYMLTGIENDKLKKKIKTTILNGIDRGDPIQDVTFELQNIFDEYESYEIERIVRTNTIRAYNFGRRKIFELDELKDFIKAYEFSAILDSRTSNICETLDTRIYKINDPYIDKITPPVHFNCRSLLIPVVEGEDFKESTKVNLERFPEALK